MNSVFQNKPLMRKHQIQLLAYSTFVSMKNAKRLLKLHLLTDSNCKYQGLITWVKWVSSDMMLSENGLLLTTSFLSFRRKQLFADFFKVGVLTSLQKQPLRGVSRKRCSENMQQIYRRTPMPKCDFNKVALQNRTPLLLRTPLGGCSCYTVLNSLYLFYHYLFS